ncbi:Spc98 family-domain-containing protein [Biscogniauxia sp. FL1348]|nr:Spc98 family-domain-containing protein [Biscogniauxia sp. FL1348]
MVFAAKLSALTEELVEIITSTSNQSEPDRFNALRESSLRKLRHHSYLRTNHFEVEEALDGYEEHFRVVNRDGLADALRERLDALAQYSNKWAPEALNFLLQLSDQPIQKSKLSDLELLKEPDEDPGPLLKWEDIAKEDGWYEERDLWKSVHFGGYSSDEDYADDRSNASVESEETTPSSIEAQYRKRPTDYLDTSPDTDGLEMVRKTQSWRTMAAPKDASGRSHKTAITEVQAVREVLFMLGGIENNLFNEQGVPSLKYQLTHASWEVYKSLLNSFGEAGRQLFVLRSFSRQPQKIPLLQVFQDAVRNRLRSFDQEISKMQARYVGAQQEVIVSLAAISNDVEPLLRPLSALSDIIQLLHQTRHPHPFHYLELLFDAASVTQLEGDVPVYQFLGEIFFECFEIYLKPIRLWMETGELVEKDKIFFVSGSPAEIPKRQVWTDRFKLRRTVDGALYAPRFLQPAASKIFTTGKSVVVLKLLGKHWSARDPMPELPLQFDADLASDQGSFALFPEVFNGLFEQWIQSKHHAASATLRQTLFQDYSLRPVLDVLQNIYLMSDGSRSEEFASAVFNNIDLLNSNWHDRFSLTEQAYEAFSTLMDAYRIAVSVPPDYKQGNVNHVRKSVRAGLPSIKMTYRLSWPTRIILSDESLAQYQSVFTFLLQLRRANYVICRHRLMSDIAVAGSPEQAIYCRLRYRLLWFCNTLHSYLSTLVLTPLVAKFHEELQQAEDVDGMIVAHSTFAKRMIDETCLGSKLAPIHECILDIFDLAIKLEEGRRLESERLAEEAQEISRLSVMSSSPVKVEKARYVKTSEEEDETFLLEQDPGAMMQESDKTYAELLKEVRADLDKHLKFVCSGLRGVARASSNAAANKWDTLAEMLEVGV